MLKNHILVVDDDNRIRELLEKYLEKNNFIVSVASNTNEARSCLEKYSIDLVILDYMLPEESGMEFLNKLRNSGSNLLIIMLTALSDVENRIEGLSFGADDYIGKPFDPKEEKNLPEKMSIIKQKIEDIDELKKQMENIYNNYSKERFYAVEQKFKEINQRIADSKGLILDYRIQERLLGFIYFGWML